MTPANTKNGIANNVNEEMEEYIMLGRSANDENPEPNTRMTKADTPNAKATGTWINNKQKNNTKSNADNITDSPLSPPFPPSAPSLPLA
jgi:hypothetical protein